MQISVVLKSDDGRDEAVRGVSIEPSAPRVSVIITEGSSERIGPFELGPMTLR